MGEKTNLSMDVIIVVPVIVFLLVLKYYLTDHDTVTDKDRKRFSDGIGLFEANDYTAAFTYFDQKIKENPKSALAYTYRGKCQLTASNLYSAIHDFTQALSFDVTLADTHFDKGKAHFLLEEFKESFLAFDKAVWFSRGANLEAIHWRNLASEKCHAFEELEK